MADDPIDFKAFKDRIKHDDDEHLDELWHRTRDQLKLVILQSGLSSGAATSCALRMLLETIDVGDFEETKKYIADRLAMFR